MKNLLRLTVAHADAVEDDIAYLRRALLLCEREVTRGRGQRKLERISERRHPVLSPIAQAGLASVSYWSGDLRSSISWAQKTVASYPMSPVAVWCLTLLIQMYRMMGMRRERFDAEGERLRVMRKIAFQGEHPTDRIFALNELQKEFESRDLYSDAERCAEELKDLIGAVRSEIARPAL